MTLHDLQSQIADLQAQRNELERKNEELMRQLNTMETKVSNAPVLSGQPTAREETFRNLPTGLSARS